MSQNFYQSSRSFKMTNELGKGQELMGMTTPIKKQVLREQNKDQEDEPTMQKHNMMRVQNGKSQYNTTPRPQRKIILYDQEHKKHLFPIYKDKQIGINKEYQDILIQSWNDDDKKTSSTQMRRGMDQTLDDLYKAFDQRDEKSSYSSQN